jgi:hypothetical protein
MDGSLFLVIRQNTCLARRCRKGAIHPIGKLKLGCGLDGEISRPFTLKDAIHVSSRKSISLD